MNTNVPTVDPESVEKLWEFYQTVPVSHSVDSIIIEQLCKPGDDMWAVVRRVTFLRALLLTQEMSPSLIHMAATAPLTLEECAN